MVLKGLGQLRLISVSVSRFRMNGGVLRIRQHSESGYTFDNCISEHHVGSSDSVVHRRYTQREVFAP